MYVRVCVPYVCVCVCVCVCERERERERGSLRAWRAGALRGRSAGAVALLVLAMRLRARSAVSHRHPPHSFSLRRPPASNPSFRSSCTSNSWQAQQQEDQAIDWSNSSEEQV